MLKLCKQETWIVYLEVSCIWISYKRALTVCRGKYAKKKDNKYLLAKTTLPSCMYDAA